MMLLVIVCTSAIESKPGQSILRMCLASCFRMPQFFPKGFRKNKQLMWYCLLGVLKQTKAENGREERALCGGIGRKNKAKQIIIMDGQMAYARSEGDHSQMKRDKLRIQSALSMDLKTFCHLKASRGNHHPFGSFMKQPKKASRMA